MTGSRRAGASGQPFVVIAAKSGNLLTSRWRLTRTGPRPNPG